MPVYLDSPLAQKITDVFLKYLKRGDIFSFPELHFVEGIKESRAIGARPGSKIILAGSGMSNGGRVLEHDKHVLPDKNSTLLIVGYQPPGGLGNRLYEGAKEVTIGGEKVQVNCKVEAIYGYSAHMDGEDLLEFVHKGKATLKKVFVVMGEPIASGTLAQRIRDLISLNAIAPHAGDKAVIEL